MANVFDIAKYILENLGPITAMKLQKLCYYSQAWSLVWEEQPLFDNRIEAWGNGPVSPELYQWHKGKFIVNMDDNLISSCNNNLTDNQIVTIDNVLNTYGKYTAQELSDLTHKENPWKIANGTCPISDHCDAEITLESMHEYYSSIPEQNVFSH
jgi:uncharacterized phage-associated protein